MNKYMVALIIVSIPIVAYSLPYWVAKKESDIKLCESKGLVYYKPYKSEPICVKGE
jgi:hypothetical protein